MVKACARGVGAFALLMMLPFCATPTPSFRVVHHSANGCDPGAAENSLAGVRCIAAACVDKSAPCGLEGDVRILRLQGGSLGDDLELVWIHDGSSARTANCAGGAIAFPGATPIDAERFRSCRLTRADGSPTNEPIPTFDEVLAALGAAPVEMTLELKPVGDAPLDHRLTVETLRRLDPARRRLTVVTSFDIAALADSKRLAPEIPTGCYIPSGHGAVQIARYLRDGALADVDTCLSAGNEWVYVPPAAIDGDIVTHVRHLHAHLGAWGVNAQDALDAVETWGDRLDAVETDHPSIFGWAR